MCDARRIPCTAHLELLDARELIAAGLHGIEHITSFGVSLLPRSEAEAYRQAVLKSNDARRDGRYRLFSGADLDGPQAQALYAVLRERKPFLDATLAVFERRPPPPCATRLRRDRRGAGSDADVRLRFREDEAAHAPRRAARARAWSSAVTPRCRLPDAVKRPGGKWSCSSRAASRRSRRSPRRRATAAAFLYRGNELGSLRAGFQRRPRRPARATRPRLSAIRTVDRVMVAGRWIDTAKYRQY